MRYLNLVFMLLMLVLVRPAVAEESAALSSPRTMTPCHCIQQLLLDFPGSTFDMYYALTQWYSCEEVGEENLWFGQPSNFYRPQICRSKQCEPYVPLITSHAGHGLALKGSNAWKMVEAGLESAKEKNYDYDMKWGEPEYHNIPRDKIPVGLEVTTDIVVMAVPVYLKSRPNGNSSPLYLSIQIDSAEGERTTKPEVVSSEPRLGRQFFVAYRLPGENSEERKGIVWLK